ncbi:DAK2 domain-containing protein [Pseudonocardia sp. KRD-184]|uniref:DAK2 domain-containing protein n=1 Tax=Pseudonocardia oceani TaxID=2792013 RepID=A0ABS6UDQ5_9PSEU|nr:DAK2 domain-containing protein [Pseudonocardia oceani]MBW0088887.1 DAK2 domain-containing protein [Pseudonocardia oceani]MBW0095806.1 DAK2 domain-containing protein [Pseudonocardia oceani]MBW0108968.1 DAK2 domain-containing protein [Pseudonocardia oceani]MBW0122170.1 DAK2 domain-containing protein [Pseudonocardia oceani]MBW0130370.1 DAK2 domain-containing protein [Pseudonocardia oceani]
MPPILDAAVLTGWAKAAIGSLERHRAEIDRINVFPVPDGDTGTNLLLTMRAALDAVGRGEGQVAAALARGALIGARGNSGVILSQVLRGVSDAVAAKAGPSAGGKVLADGLGRAHRLATAAVTRPREGTVLSVLSAAAVASVAVGSDRLDAVAVAAADAARDALCETTGQLPELARAGVVDAGGLGLYLVLDALAALVSGRAGSAFPEPSPGRGPARGRDALVAARESGSPAFDYEVMYLLQASGEAVAVLRAELDELGDSVAVVGDGTGTWNVHVHCTDVGAAVEAGVVAGRPHRITVVRFADQLAPAPDRFDRPRAVLLVAAGAELGELARSAGADVLAREDAVDHRAVHEALVATRARHVVLLPADNDLLATAERAATAARRDGQEVLVLPTASVLQGLSALAVHDPERRAADDVVAMAEAAALTRTAALVVAETEAMTWVGRCEPGEVLGLSDGEVVLIAPDLAVGALWLAHRMLTAGGEIVTALLGEGADDALGEGLATDLRRTHPEVDVVVHRGGQTDYPIVLGVE